MTTSIAHNTQSLSFLTNTRAVLEIHAVPDISYNCHNFSIPSISTSAPRLATPFTDIPMRGDTLSYAPLDITFLVDENLENWKTMVGWLEGITAPHTGDEFKNKKLEYSDATIFVYSSHNNLVLEVAFKNLTPTSLGGLTFDTTNESTIELTADVSFDYQSYEVVSIRKRTSE